MCLAYGGWKKITSIASAQDLSVIVQADGQLSDEARNTIKVYVQSLLKKALPLNEVGHLLRQAFPHLAHVSVTKDPFKKIRIAAVASRPLAVCNDAVVLCANDVLAAKEIFGLSKVEALPAYQVADAQLTMTESLSDFKKFVISCNAALHDQYKIAWNAPHEIYLHDKAQPKLSLIIDQESIKNMAPLALAYATISKSLLEKESIKSKKNKILAWNIDGRFKNQMIVMPKGVVG
jgi:hypothetical protein